MASEGLTVHNAAGGRAVQIGVNESGAYNYIQSSYVNNSNVAVNLAFFTGASERMRIDSTGKVGIGVTSPSSILHINDAISGDDSQFRITNGAGATLRMGITGNGANQAAHIKTNSSENLEFHIGQASNSATPKVIFTADGAVGIGTNNPLEALHVNGNILGTEASSLIKDIVKGGYYDTKAF